jgi:hypothetical protein
VPASGGKFRVAIDLDASGLNRGVSQATRSLRKFDRDGTRSVRNVDRATHTLGNSFRSAARYAAGAAAAYLSISQAQAAVEQTIELYKATSNLTLNLGMATEEASAFAAVAKSRGIEVTQLGMAFKTLSTQVEQAKDGSESSTGVFQSLGISLQDLKTKGVGGLLVDISKGLQGMGAGTERVNAASKLMGRGWQSMLPLLREGPKALKDNLKYAKEVGATFDDLGFKKAGDLRSALLKVKLAQIGLQKNFTLALAPAITFAATKMADFAKIVNDPKLSTNEKITAIGQEITKTFKSIDWKQVGNWISKGIQALVPVFTQITTQITPPLVEGFMVATPKIIAAIAVGLWNSKGELFSTLLNMGSTGASMFGKAMGRWFESKIRGVFGPVGDGFKLISNGAKGAAKLTASVFRAALGAVKSVASSIWNAMSNAFGKVKAGANAVKSVFVSAFNTVKGVVQDVADAIGNLKGTIASMPGKIRDVLGFQRGGFIPGVGEGDTIPALLEPGEFVMNRRAVSAIGLDRLMAMNSAVPRFAKGGVARLEANLAGAELTPTTSDDLTALKALERYWTQRERRLQRPSKWIGKGENKRKVMDWQALTQARQTLKGYRDDIANLGGDSVQLEETNRLLSEQLQISRNATNVATSQYGVLVQALSAAISGQIGGRVGLGVQTPSTAGRLASY